MMFIMVSKSVNLLGKYVIESVLYIGQFSAGRCRVSTRAVNFLWYKNCLIKYVSLLCVHNK